MGKNKIGRNDPCPCGSGKKYKQCCMVLEDGPTADLFTRCSQMMAAVKLKLDDAYKANIKRIRKDARQFFCHYTVNQQLTGEQEALFSDWLWFDYRQENQRTLAEDYLSDHRQYMPAQLQECLHALSDSYLSVYEPTHIGDHYLELRDIFTEARQQVTLKESLDADLNEKPLLLLGRMVGFAEGQVFSGMVLAVDNNDGQASYLQKHVRYLAAIKGEADTVTLLKNHADVLLGLFDHALRKKLLNINDIRYLPFADPSQHLAIQAWLEANQGMQYVNKYEDLTWYQDQQAGVYKMLALTENYVLTCAGGLDELYQWEALSGEDIKPPREWQLVNSNLHRQPPPLELAAIWFTVLQQQETERWLRTCHPELEEKTPLEIIQEEKGRERINRLLDKFASQLEENEEASRLVACMRARVEALSSESFLL